MNRDDDPSDKIAVGLIHKDQELTAAMVARLADSFLTSN
jgi:hypothetical protein